MTRIRKTWEEILGDFEIVGDCWEYQGHLFREYGYYKYEGKNYPVHRMSYKVYVGEIPDDLVIDHLCRNHRCINPEHLEAVTSKENVLRGEGITARRARQTHCKHGHKLTPKNIYPYKGWRICRKCHRANDLKYKARKRLIKQGETIK